MSKIRSMIPNKAYRDNYDRIFGGGSEDKPVEKSRHWETECPKVNDKTHCVCWYDGEACCACGDPAQEKCRG